MKKLAMILGLCAFISAPVFAEEGAAPAKKEEATTMGGENHDAAMPAKKKGKKGKRGAKKAAKEAAKEGAAEGAPKTE